MSLMYKAGFAFAFWKLMCSEKGFLKGTIWFLAIGWLTIALCIMLTSADTEQKGERMVKP